MFTHVLFSWGQAVRVNFRVQPGFTGPVPQGIMVFIGKLFKIMVPKLSLRRPFANLAREPCALQQNQYMEYYDHVFVFISRINSGIQTFHEPFAALSRSFATAEQIYIHICRCHSDTKGLT